MDFNFEDVKEKMKEVKELVWHDLSKKEWIQAFNGWLEYWKKRKN
jgi:hypothetical protein